MSEFHDPDFENLLGRSGGPMPDVNIAYQRVQGRVRQAKRRRAIVASSAACVVVFGAAVFASARTSGTDTVSPAGRGDDTGSIDDSHGEASTLTPDSTITSITLLADSTLPTETSTVAGDGGTPTSTDGSQPGSTTPGGSTPGVTNPPVTNPPATNPPATDPPTTNAPATNPPAPVDRTFTAAGNSITVRMQNGALTLLSSSPASGYTPEVRKNGGTRVEVRFDNGTDTVDIRVDLLNGQMVQH